MVFQGSNVNKIGHSSNNYPDVMGALVEGINAAGNKSARAAANANGVSFASQAAQGAFNQGSANIANGLGTDRTLSQYAFNSAQAASANAFTQASWDQAASYNQAAWERAAQWNEAMMERQMEFNHNEAALNRQWQQQMAETAYQRAVKDMRAAGINPILAAGGISTGSGGGSAASVGSPSMSPYSMGAMGGQSASGGLLNGVAASEGNFSGQMEYMAGMLGLISTAIAAMNSAITYAGQGGPSIANMFEDIMTEYPARKEFMRGFKAAGYDSLVKNTPIGSVIESGKRFLKKH